MTRFLTWMLVGAAVGIQGVAGSQVGGLSQPPARDARIPPIAVGTGMISGKVVTADTGIAVRRATVMLVGGPRGRSTMSDDEGLFVFADLPPGKYSLNVNPGLHRPGYRAAAFGATPGSPRPRQIELADGQRVGNLVVQLPRAGVIAGRVTDMAGEPLGRVQVRALMLRYGSEPSTVSGASTDDLGQFRLSGLAPGEYLVMADAPPSGPPQDVEGEPIGFAPTYAPGTPVRDEATRLRLADGIEAVADIRLLETRVFRISGTVVMSSGEQVERPTVQLMRADPSVGYSSGGGMGPAGRFTFRNVAPGEYNLVARYSRPAAPGELPGPPRDEMGIQRIDVTTTDIDDVVVVMRGPESVTGQILYEPSPPADVRAAIQPQQPEPRTLTPQPTADVQGDRFTIKRIFGPFLLRGNASGGGTTWTLKAVLLDGRDVTDVPMALGSPHNGRLQIVFTSAGAALEGTVTDESGRPTRDAAVLLFGSEESSWVPMSSRTRLTGIPADDGKFGLRHLREGRYYAVALPPGIPINMAMPGRQLLESLRKVATEVTLTAGDTRTIDLRIVRIEQ